MQNVKMNSENFLKKLQENLTDSKVLWGLAAIIVPGGGIVLGSILIYKALNKKGPVKTEPSSESSE